MALRSLPSLRFLAGIAQARLTGRAVPLSVIVNVTSRCNCRCAHCYAAYHARGTEDALSLDQIRSIFRDLRRNGCARVSLSGGEPLLRGDIAEIIACAAGEGLSCTLNSNGILVPERLAALRGVDALAISLDGRPEHHDVLRGAGTGDRAFAGVLAAARAGIRVHTNTVLHRHSVGDVDYMLDLARRNRFMAAFAIPISTLSGEGVEPRDLKPSDEEIRAALRLIIRRKREGAPVLFSEQAYRSVLECWQDFSVEGVLGTAPPAGMPPCPAGKFFCMIDADGTLWACPHLIGKIPALNVLEVGVEKAWRAARPHPCTGCYQVYHHEFSLIMRMRPAVLWNYLRAAATKG